MAGRNTTRAEVSHVRSQERSETRRRELAAAAIETLAERGYANTSLRDISQHSTFSHGVMHYYFTDKLDLISYAVNLYSVQRHEVMAAAASASEDAETFLAETTAALAAGAQEYARFFTVYYDLRTQSVFEPGLRPVMDRVDEERRADFDALLQRYASLARREIVVDPLLAHSCFDGLVFQSVLKIAAGVPTDPAQLAGDLAATARIAVGLLDPRD